MIICIDVGNTNIKYGIFDGDELVVSFRVATDMKRTSDQYGTAIIDMLAVKGISASAIDGAIISSVVPSLNYTISHMCVSYLGVEPLMVGAGLKTEHNLRIDNAREMGADRIVNDVAAIRKYGAPVIVIALTRRFKVLWVPISIPRFSPRLSPISIPRFSPRFSPISIPRFSPRLSALFICEL